MSAQELGARYLIITHDNFYNDVLPLAEWKHKKGLRTKVIKLSEIGSSSYQIKNYITQAYNTWPTPPEFLLLVGAPSYVPFAQISYTYTDNYYTNITGDIYNEILSGRLTVHSTTEAQSVISKILAYERTPDITDSSWFTSTCLIARLDYDSDDSIYWSDVHHAADLMIDNGFTKIDTLSNYYGHNYTHILAAVNEGRSIVMYRGSGLNNWYSPFNVDPNSAQNNTKVPIVLSLTCRTMGTGSSPSTAERWLLTGSAAQPRGAAGFFATTTTVVGQAYLRSAVCRGFIDAVFVDHKKTFGEACEAGRINVYQMYPYQGGGDEYYGFTTLGDPAMNLWTAFPKALVVTHDTMLWTGEDTFNIHVEHDEMPVESAYVCIVLDSTIYETGYTDNIGNLSFALSLDHEGDMSVTVTGTNLYPYEGVVSVVTGIEESNQYPLLDPGSAIFKVMPSLFIGNTSIRLNAHAILKQSENPELYICDVRGARVKTYDLSRLPDAISYTVQWSGLDDQNQVLPAGVYFIRLDIPGAGDNNTRSVIKKTIKLQ
jgi:hypothetical protein